MLLYVNYVNQFVFTKFTVHQGFVQNPVKRLICELPLRYDKLIVL